MEIKKADSKGRVSGFEPERYYQFHRGEAGTVSMVPVAESGDRMDFALPIKVSEEALDYLRSFGVDPNNVSRDGWTETGYTRLQRFNPTVPGEYGEWHEWPEGFDLRRFLEKAWMVN